MSLGRGLSHQFADSLLKQVTISTSEVVHLGNAPVIAVKGQWNLVVQTYHG
jgi:hypothetical protein